MHIGFYFESVKQEGGAYQVALNHLEALRDIQNHEFIIFNTSLDFPFDDFKNLPNFKIIDLIKRPKNKTEENPSPTSTAQKKQNLKRKVVLFFLDILRFFHLYRLENFLARFKARARAKIFDGYGLDLLLFHGTSELSIYTNIPSVVIIHDIHHRLYPQFPEMSEKGQWTKREYTYSRIDKNTFRIYVDSEVGKEDLARVYNIDPKKIVILRPLPPPYIRTEISQSELVEIRKKYNLPEKFLFYPAQFWPHKNHKNLVLAAKILRDQGVTVPIVLVGSKKELWGEYDRVVNLVKESGLERQVLFLGFVPIEDISPLYRLATGLIMPVYVGWTYVPIVEAWAMECPIIYSTARGCREQGGDSALYVDPYKPEDIALKIKEFWQNPQLRATLIENGKLRLAAWTRKDFNSTIENVINEFEQQKHHSSK
ncbi:MAG: glycosyltransferase family 1 protein [Patescibacteria group bacterium]